MRFILFCARARACSASRPQSIQKLAQLGVALRQRLPAVTLELDARHSRNELLKPTMRVDKFRETVRLVKERDPDVIIQISTGGRAPPVQFEGVDVGEWRMDPLNLMPGQG